MENLREIALIIRIIICVVPVVMLCLLLLWEHRITMGYIRVGNFVDVFKSREERLIRRLLFILYLVSILLMGLLFNVVVSLLYVIIMLFLHQEYLDCRINRLFEAEFDSYSKGGFEKFL